MSTLYSANFTDGTILLTERTHTIKFTYSRSVRAYIRQLANCVLHGSRKVLYHDENRPSSRPNKKRLDNIIEDCFDLEITLYEATQLAESRGQWRRIVHSVGCHWLTTFSNNFNILR